jgi:hypothetical protein
VNYGRNYEGAPDDYVYIYSPDGPSAYVEYDQVVLARVAKDHIRDRQAYEFFQQVDANGQAIWTQDIQGRGPVFAYPGHCRRLGAIYHQATNRYWLVLAFNEEGGWGIFDAPTPWGPWTTVYFTEYWGLSKSHSYRFPTKWISNDGKDLHLVFSGRRHHSIDYDAFCVRKMNLSILSSK